MKKIILLGICLAMVVLVSACGSNKGIEILDVYFSRDQSDEGLNARENAFYPPDVVYFNVEIDGQPKEGTLSVDYQFNNYSIATTEFTFPADIEKGITTHVYFDLEAVEPLSISNNYKVVLGVNGEEFGEYDFSVKPPENAIPSQIKEAKLAYLDLDTEDFVETNIFSQDEFATLIFASDLGEYSWFETLWYTGDHETGDIIIDCGIAGMSPENLVDEVSTDSCMPGAGWEIGEHEVILYLNDEIAGVYPFTIE